LADKEGSSGPKGKNEFGQNAKAMGPVTKIQPTLCSEKIDLVFARRGTKRSRRNKKSLETREIEFHGGVKNKYGGGRTTRGGVKRLMGRMENRVRGRGAKGQVKTVKPRRLKKNTHGAGPHSGGREDKTKISNQALRGEKDKDFDAFAN